jgi:hypothetical protein
MAVAIAIESHAAAPAAAAMPPVAAMAVAETAVMAEAVAAEVAPAMSAAMAAAAMSATTMSGLGGGRTDDQRAGEGDSSKCLDEGGGKNGLGHDRRSLWLKASSSALQTWVVAARKKVQRNRRIFEKDFCEANKENGPETEPFFWT